MELSEFLRRTSKRERANLAELCQTSVPYLYQLAGRHRHASPALARRVEAHTKAFAARSADHLDAVPGWSLMRDPTAYEGPPDDRDAELTLRTVGIAKIRPYQNNAPNPSNRTYQRIKASIRRNGFRQLLAVIQPPGEDNYVLCNGGSARLRALEELFAETGAARYATVTCIVRPWQGEADQLLAHLEEESLRDAPSFIDLATTVAQAKRVVERDAGGDQLSHAAFAAYLAERNCDFSPLLIAQMAYAVQRLVPLLPVALNAGMGQQEVERIRILDRAALAIWLERKIDTRAEYDLAFATLCQRYDGEDWDTGSLRRALEAEVAGRRDVSVHEARLDIEAGIRRLRHAPLATLGGDSAMPDDLIDV